MVGSAAAGASPTLFEYNYIRRAPLDVLDPDPSSAVASVVIRYNFLQSTCTTLRSFGLHADVTQVVGWAVAALEYHNNVMRLDCPDTPYLSSVTGPLNFGVSTTVSGDAYFHDNIMYGGSYSVFHGDPGGTPTGTIRFINNYSCNTNFPTDIFGNGGFLYFGIPAYPNLTITNVYGACSNQQLNFRWNDGGVSSVVTQVP